MVERIVVAGAGISGLSLAILLGERGYEVLLVEQGPGPGWNATGRAAGIITRQVYLKHDLTLINQTLGFLQERYEWLLYPRDSVTLYSSHGPMNRCMEWLAGRWGRLGVQYTVLDAGSLRGLLDGYLIGEGDRGLLTRGDAQVDVGSLSTAMAADVERLGGELWFETAVHGYKIIGDSVVVETSRGPVEAEKLVIAGGPWNPRLLPMLRGRVHVYRCQLQSLSTPPAGEGLIVFAVDESFYHAPESSGRSLIGDGCEFLGEPEEGLQPSIEVIADLSQRIGARLPGALEAGLEAVWSAACDVGMDGLPYAGPIDNKGLVWVLGGFDGYGVMRAPAVSSMVAEAVSQGKDLPGWLAVGRLLRYPVPRRRAVLELHSPLCGEPPECS